MEQIKTKQRVKGESLHLCKLQMENRVKQTAKADSVINGVYCLKPLKTQVASLDYYGAIWDKIYCRNFIEFFFLTVENSEQIIVLEAFTLTACTQTSI